MNNRATRLPTRLDVVRPWWQSEAGGVGIREMIALVAVAVTIVAAVAAGLEVAGFDTGGWLREQFGTAP